MATSAVAPGGGGGFERSWTVSRGENVVLSNRVAWVGHEGHEKQMHDEDRSAEPMVLVSSLESDTCITRYTELKNVSKRKRRGETFFEERLLSIRISKKKSAPRSEHFNICVPACNL